MQAVGQLLLICAFFTTLLTALAAYYAAVTRSAPLMRGARYGVYANCLLYFAMAAVLWHGLYSHDFANSYIATYTDGEMPLVYLFTSFWGGEKGALLFWSMVLTAFSAIAIHQARDKDIAYLGWAAGILMSAVFFFDILMVFESSPFETFISHEGPVDGDGLNPLLQNPTMAVHPPSLLTGYIAFTVPFAFGASALITGRLGNEWAKETRKWTIVSWLFLTVGLVLGGYWAYHELGWGGFWMWDPVENAGLIPWFTATAFLHSIIVQERRSILRRWNFTLVCLTFLLTIFGTFLTRSQLIVSIHAFADSSLSEYFLVYMLVIFLISAGLLTWRWQALKAKARITNFMSKEAFFVLNNVVLVLCAFIVMWGTLYSKVSASDSFQAVYNGGVDLMNNTFGTSLEGMHTAQELGEPWFNSVMVPAGLLLLALMSVGPLIAWRKTTVRIMNKVFLWPFLAATVPVLVGTGVLIAYRSHAIGYDAWANTVGLSDVYAFISIWFCLFVLTGVVTEFWRGGAIRKRRHEGGMIRNMLALMVKSKRRYGGYVIHVGAALAFLGFTGAAFKSTTPETPLHLGEGVDCGSYRLTYTSMTDEYRLGEGYGATTASVVALRSGETVPVSEVDRVSAFLESRTESTFHVSTEVNNPKILVRFSDAEERDWIVQELYLAGPMRDRFEMVNEDPANNRLWFTFRDKNLIQLQVGPRMMHKHLNDVRRVLGGLRYGAASVQATPGQARFSVAWGDVEDYNKARGIMRADPPIEGLLMAKNNPVTDVLEVVTSGTGRVLLPEVRFYRKHGNPTTEVATWDRGYEELYLAMRPDFGEPHIQLLSVVNPLINLLWLGTLIMFLGGIFLLFPNHLLVGRAQRLADQLEPIEELSS